MVRVLVLLAACRPNGPEDERPAESRHHVVQDSVEDFDVEDPPIASGTTLAAPDDGCSEVVLTPDVSFSATVAIRTRDDFDFDVLGFLDTPRNGGVAGYSRSGDPHVVARQVGSDAIGIRSLATGDLVVAMPQTGILKLVSYESGETSTIIGGLSNPRELEAGADGMIYVSEYYEDGTVRMIDPYSGDNEVIARLPFPTGMALSPDDQTLYIATTGQWYSGPATIAAIDRDEDGAWNPTLRWIFESQNLADALATDVCGNLYVGEPLSGRVYRIRAADGGVDPLATLAPGPFGLVAMRFGHGLGDFDRDQLFVSNRSQVYILEIGIDGRHVLAQ